MTAGRETAALKEGRAAGKMISDSALQDLKDRNPVNDLAGRWVTLRRHGNGFIGPCPIHSPDPHARDSTSFECDGDSWVCATCCDGGDVIRLVEKVNGLDFLGAIEWLGGARDIDHAEAAKRDLEHAARRAACEKDASHFREKERRTLFGIWRRAVSVTGTPVADYLALRRLEVPPGARLRCMPDMPLYDKGGKDAVVVHRGPAMLGAVIGGDGRFLGLHITWIDLTQPNGKASVTNPETGQLLPSKKVRGSKQGGIIELAPVPIPRQLIIGEGIETTLSVWRALNALGRDISATAFWSAVDLGNLGGRASATIQHPTERDAGGRPRRVPGPAPDLASPAIALPSQVVDVVLLGDGDSDPFLTQCALARAAKRFAREGRTVRAAWAPNGGDFNDLIREAV